MAPNASKRMMRAATLPAAGATSPTPMAIDKSRGPQCSKLEAARNPAEGAAEDDQETHQAANACAGASGFRLVAHAYLPRRPAGLYAMAAWCPQ